MNPDLPNPFSTDSDQLRPLLDHLRDSLENSTDSSSIAPSMGQSLRSLISDHVIQILADSVRPPHIEADLLALRELVLDEDVPLSKQDHIRHVNRAQEIIGRLQVHLRRLSEESPKQAGQHEDLPGEHEGEVFKRPPHSTTSPRKEWERRIKGSLTPGPQGRPGTEKLWELPIRFAKGVGPKRSALLEKLGVRTVEEALWFLPWRYEDRSVISPIRTLQSGLRATISGTVRSARLKTTRRRGFTILTVTIQDQSGPLEAVFFNQPYLEKTLTPGTRVIINGMVSSNSLEWGLLQMKSPQYEVLDQEEELLLHVGRVVPIYHETRGLTSRHIRRMMKGLIDHYLPQLEEILPPSIREKHQLPTITQAITVSHFPDTNKGVGELNAWATSAHRRLAFEECLLLQIALALRQQENKEEVSGIQFPIAGPWTSRLQERLPFHLTPAQERVINDIYQDMARSHPMNRLVQGDVGSGKTVVALHAMVMACGAGYQAALMAPTEILAEQHYLSMHKLFTQLGLEAELVKGGMSPKGKAMILERIQSGKVQVIIGTHALLQQEVEFAKLGLVVVDEQHKFGVLQRAKLREKGLHPDVLVMTATPIPRTLAMTAYGDLDVSVIDRLPPGRKPIRTLLFRKSERKRAYRQLGEQVKSGRQAYVVYPLVEESEKVDLEAAQQAAERLQTEEFPTLRVGLLHGRMKSDEKARTMAAFRDKEIDILVATTVIEVGLDVPNATVMLIEHAERFGLAQLHQLRGRVGRGDHPSVCLLVSASVRKSTGQGLGLLEGSGQGLPKSASLPYAKDLGHSPGMVTQPTSGTQSAQERLRAMVECADGFAIAEEDLRIRGPGEFLGVRQWGVPEFKVVDLIRDGVVLEQARQEAFSLIADDPHLSRPEHRSLKSAMMRRWQKKFELGSVG